MRRSEKNIAKYAKKCNEAVKKVSCTMSREKYGKIKESAREYCVNKHPDEDPRGINNLFNYIIYQYENRLGIEKGDTVRVEKYEMIKACFGIAKLGSPEVNELLSYVQAFLLRAFFPKQTPEEEKYSKKLSKAVASLWAEEAEDNSERLDTGSPHGIITPKGQLHQEV